MDERKLDEWNRERTEANADNVPGQAYRSLQAKLARAVDLLGDLEWSANIGQNGYGCGLCQADAYHRRGGDHYEGCKLAAFLKEAAS